MNADKIAVKLAEIDQRSRKIRKKAGMKHHEYFDRARKH